MESIRYSVATIKDAEAAAKLFVIEKNLSWQEALETFKNEFSFCSENPHQRIYFLAQERDDLLSYAGARHYDSKTDENM